MKRLSYTEEARCLKVNTQVFDGIVIDELIRLFYLINESVFTSRITHLHTKKPQLGR